MAVYLLGIDVGTSSCKVALFREDGTVAASGGSDYPVSYPRRGWAEQEPEDWWQGICRAVRTMLGESGIDSSDIAGIGVDGHIAFNDPPADFGAKEAYRVVNLDHKCRMQQVGEGWFATEDDVPKQAISMLPGQIMSCKTIVSVVPHAVKAKAIYDTITQPVNNMVPATLLKTHPEWYLFIDDDSASMLIK